MTKSLQLFLIFIISTTTLFADEEVGSASYYNNRFHGRKTASGECYYKHKYTCAHRYFPFGTLLKVTNPRNGKSVIVKVNDRGPFHHKRIVDLSYQAADDLGIIKHGVAQVRLEKIEGMPIKLPPIPFQLQTSLQMIHLDTLCIPERLVR